jgi:hypothetical protein
MLTKIFTMITFLLMSSVASAHGPVGHRHIQQHIQCDERLIHIPGRYDTFGRWIPGATFHGIQCWDSMGNIISQTPIVRPIVRQPVFIPRRPPARVIVVPRVRVPPVVRRVPPPPRTRRPPPPRHRRTSPRTNRR